MYVKLSAILFLYCCVAVKSEEYGLKSKIRKLQCECGQANERTSKIIGGDVVPAHKYPWMVTVQVDDSYCGGTLLTRQYVLTAAHCVTNSRNIKVGIAVHEVNRPGEIIPASKVKIHPAYGETAFFDIALIKLQRAVKISERVRTLCLPNNIDFEQPGKDAIVAGWGLTQSGDVDSQSQFLKEANLTIKRARWIIIAKGENDTSVCNGDSGSPLFTKYDDGKYHVIGVTSRGKEERCIGASYYARVFLHNEWIMHNIKNSPPCKTVDDQISPDASNRM